MTKDDGKVKSRRTGLLVRPSRSALALIICIGLIDPLSHVLIMNFPPEGTVPTGGHTVDTFNYLTGMQYAHPPWFSPYSLCGDPHADGDATLFAIPHHHLFGLAGTIGKWLHIPPFYMISLANGLCAAFYLYAVYCFLVLAVPRLAGRAFLLFGLGGGLGGLLYVLTWPFGIHDHPEFGRYFLRYFIYELSEGPRFQPWLMAARLYYTISFGFGFFALATLVRSLRRERRYDLFLAALLLGITTFLNFRVGPMLWAVGLLLHLCQPMEAGKIGRIAVGAAVTLFGVLLGGAAAMWMVSRNPELVESVARSQRTALWFSPMLSATFFYWLILPGALTRSVKTAPPLLRVAGCMALGYILAFALLYAGYQAYYGNFLLTGEFKVAVIMSDYALLLGVPLGFALTWWYRRATPVPSVEPSTPSWAALWFLAFFAVSFSAWGQGWFLRFTPDRFAIVLGVPLAVLAAAAIERGLPRYPRFYRGLQYTILGCGLLSILVTWLVSYGPLGYHTLQRHYSWTRNAFMNQADVEVLGHLEEGVVLAPASGAPLMGDLAVMRGNPTVYGIGTLDYSRHVVTGIRSEVAEFYGPETPEVWRSEKIEAWCVRYIYCPDTDPVSPETVGQLRGYSWLREVASAGNAVLFEVR